MENTQVITLVKKRLRNPVKMIVVQTENIMETVMMVVEVNVAIRRVVVRRLAWVG